MRPLVGDRLRLAQGGHLRGMLVALRRLIEVDPVGEDLVVRLDLRVNPPAAPGNPVRSGRSRPRAGTRSRARACRACGRRRAVARRDPRAAGRWPRRRRGSTGRRSGNARSCRTWNSPSGPSCNRGKQFVGGERTERLVGGDEHRWAGRAGRRASIRHALASVLAVQPGDHGLPVLVADLVATASRRRIRCGGAGPNGLGGRLE